MVQIVLKMHSIEGGLFHRAKMHSKWGGNFHGSNRAKNALSWGGTFHRAKNALDWGGTFHVSNRAKNALILKCPWRGRCRVLSKIIKNIFSSKLIILHSIYLASFKSVYLFVVAYFLAFCCWFKNYCILYHFLIQYRVMAGLFISYSNEKARHDTGKNLYVFASFECFILFFAVLILRCGTFHVRFECGGQ